MNEILLLVVDDFEPYKGRFGNAIDSSKLLAFVQEAQELDLKPSIGPALFRDFITNRTQQIYLDLLNGKEYVWNTDTIFFEGLKPALVYWSYARYLRMSSVQHTASGMVQKNTPESTPAPEKTVAALVSQASTAAISYLNEAVRFLGQNTSTYPLWKTAAYARRKSGLKITPVGGNSSKGLKYRNCDDCGYCPEECRCTQQL